MARSKNRILYVGKDDYGKVITAKVELENGEVVIADYERRGWVLPPRRTQALLQFRYVAATDRPVRETFLPSVRNKRGGVRQWFLLVQE